MRKYFIVLLNPSIVEVKKQGESFSEEDVVLVFFEVVSNREQKKFGEVWRNALAKLEFYCVTDYFNKQIRIFEVL